MPRVKPLDYRVQVLAVDLSQQLRPGSFEYALQHLIDHEIGLPEIEARYANDVEGQRAAIEPHRQRVGQDGYRQGRHPGLHRGGRGG